MKKLILCLLLPALLLAGCNKQNAVTYSGIEAGTLDSGVFTSDNGTRMTVVGNDQKYDVSTSRRVLISYETHPVTDTDHIDIDILALLEAGILPADRVNAIPGDPDGAPIQVSDAWFSADYLNVLIAFEGEDPTKHAFTADYAADEKGIVFRLHHDASQEPSSSKALSVFLSIPVYEPVLVYEQCAAAVGLKAPYPAPVTLQWTALTLDGGPQSVYERQGSYTPPAAN